MQKAMEWRLKALTPLWTGDANRKEEQFIPTGLMGSLRWWFEVLVRGLGGSACDPTVQGVRCPQDSQKKPTDPGHHCVVCELFGCTGWARKFRLMVLDENGEVIQKQIQADQKFILRFIPLRPIRDEDIRDEEWCLLDLTLRLIADYGAIGGKTVLKPSEEWGIADLGVEDLEEKNGQVTVRRSRRGLPLQKGDVILEVEGSQISSIADIQNVVSMKPHGESIKVKIRRSGGEEKEIEAWAGKRHHQDFGLIQIIERPNALASCTHEQLERYVRQERWRRVEHNDFAWASLRNFWCVKGKYLARQDANTSSFNFVIGRPEPKGQSSQGDSWLAGRRPNRQLGIEPEGKKVFSFKEPEEGRRTFGFVQNEQEFSLIVERLEILRDGDAKVREPDPAWQNFDLQEFLKGEQILAQLFKKGEGA